MKPLRCGYWNAMETFCMVSLLDVQLALDLQLILLQGRASGCVPGRNTFLVGRKLSVVNMVRCCAFNLPCPY